MSFFKPKKGILHANVQSLHKYFRNDESLDGIIKEGKFIPTSAIGKTVEGISKIYMLTLLSEKRAFGGQYYNSLDDLSDTLYQSISNNSIKGIVSQPSKIERMGGDLTLVKTLSDEEFMELYSLISQRERGTYRKKDPDPMPQIDQKYLN